MEEILKLSQGSAYLQVSSKTFRKWVKQGIIPVLKICRDIRVRRSDLDKLFEAKKQE